MISRALKRHARTLTRPLWRAFSFKGHKTFSAMVRVRNEEEFLFAAVASIAAEVEHVVIVDNLSDDGTPEIIRQLQEEFPGKIDSYAYPHKIARPGVENIDLASTREGRRSPRLLANYYNWCLQKCREPFVIKWDGDTIALPTFLAALDEFRSSPAQVMSVGGVNVHPGLRHTVKSPDDDVGDDGKPWYVRESKIRHIRPYEDHEPRVFPRRFASYTNRDFVCESLWTPYKYEPFSSTCAPMAYLHMKHCKRDLYTNLSPEMKPAEEARWECGDPLDQGMVDCLRQWRIEPPAAKPVVPRTERVSSAPISVASAT